MTELPRIAVTSGDPAGVGPEVLERWLATNPEMSARLVPYGPADWTHRIEERIGHSGVVVGPDDYRSLPGRPDTAGAEIAWEALRKAAVDCRSGRVDAVVTGPISKAALAAVGFSHPGHTEFFAATWGGTPVMAFTGGRLRLALATWHIPLSAVPAQLTPDRLERAVRAVNDLAVAEGITHPRLVVCGLNPHAGEGGLIGSEEREWIDPLLLRLAGQGLAVGPTQPADTVFGRMVAGEFDGVVALYHDQGLAPLKTIDFEQAVNVTLGLPHVRTSPDHGTAFGIAGKGIARWDSMANAIRVAARLVVHRRVSHRSN